MVVKSTSTISGGEKPLIEHGYLQDKKRKIVNPTLSGGKTVLEKQFNWKTVSFTVGWMHVWVYNLRFYCSKLRSSTWDILHGVFLTLKLTVLWYVSTQHVQWKTIKSSKGTGLSHQRATLPRYHSWFVMVYWAAATRRGPDVYCDFFCVTLWEDTSMTFLLTTLLCVARWVRVLATVDVSPWKRPQCLVVWLDR